MNRRIAIPAALLATCIAAPAHGQAPAAKATADPPFMVQCASNSTRMLPKGNAGAGKVEFEVRVDPAAQSVTVEGGEKRKATIDQYEVWFKASSGDVISISRSMKTFRLVVPIKEAEDSRKYLLFEGPCKIL